MYKIIVSNRAIKEIDELPDKVFIKLDNIIQQLKIFPRLTTTIKLSNSDEYRIRIGEYRLLYEIDDNEKEVRILKIAHRKDVYKKK